ncbi:MAG: sugar phosphate isomerase/epimerase [Clostridia bacterium]|nr:sugar phosphate isomerase/epimerase [Clostridia bacterium]
MHISVSKVSDSHIPFVAQAGFFGVDESFAGHTKRDEILTEEYDKAVLARFERLKAQNLAVCQTHLTFWPGHIPPVGDGTYEDYEAFFLPVLAKEIMLTEKMCCRTAVMHPYFEVDREKSREGNVRLIEKLLPLLERHHVVLSLENIYGPGYGDVHLSTAEDLLYYTERFQSPYVGICLDTGHAVIRGQDPVAMLEKIAHRLTALHLHTTIPREDFHCIPYMIGYGDRIDWERFYEVLSRSAYEGTFNMEVKIPKSLSDAAAALYYQLSFRIAKDIVGG